MGSGHKVVRPMTTTNEPPKNVWCCNCAKQGHYVHQCRAYSYSPYPPSVPFVVTYNDPVGPESLEVSGNDDDDRSRESFAVKSGMKRSRKMRQIKSKRREFLSLGSTPTPSDAESRSRPPKAKKR